MSLKTKNILIKIIMAWLLVAAAAGGIFVFLNMKNVKFSYNIVDDVQQVQFDDDLPVVVLDAGHGGYDPGSIGAAGTYEKDITLSLILKVGGILESEYDNLHVVYTRTSDEVAWPSEEAQDLAWRVAIAQSCNADFYFALHLNSSEDCSAQGYYGICRNDDTFSQQLLEDIYAGFESSGWMGKKDTKYTQEIPLYVVDNLACPSTLLEIGFISNEQEEQELSSTFIQNKLARVIAENIAQSVLSLSQ
jgi:N-acetylmuramoyl-L-alanine amidase